MHDVAMALVHRYVALLKEHFGDQLLGIALFGSLARHPPLLLDLTTDAIILYDTGVVSRELERLKKRLEELGAKKIRTGCTWFWILKPDLKLGEVVEL